MPWKKPGQTSPDESQQPTPNVVEQEKGRRRGIIQDERGQDQPASKEDARLGGTQAGDLVGLSSIVCFAFCGGKAARFCNRRWARGALRASSNPTS